MLTTLDKKDFAFAVHRLPKNLVDIMFTDGWLGKVVIGGGYLRSVVAGEKVNDIDLFVRSKSDGKLLALMLTNGDADKVYETQNALTIRGGRYVIQIITRWTYREPIRVAQSFDFTICSAVIWVNPVTRTWNSYCHERFYLDLAAKRLTYMHPKRNEDAGGSMLRVLKYYQKGYRITTDSLAGVVARLVSKLDTITYAERAIGNQIEKLLHEVDPEIDPEHLSHLPSSK